MFNEIKNKKIVVCGDIMIDRYWFGDVDRISPEAPVPVLKVNRIDDRLGGAANVAANVAGVGANSFLVSVVGADDNGKYLKNIAKSSGIYPDFIEGKNLRTTLKLRMIGKNQQLLRCDFEDGIHESYLFDLKSHINTHLSDANILILSDYKKGVLNKSQDLISLANTYNVPVLVDPKGDNYNKYSNSFLIKPNKKELESVIGCWNSEDELTEKVFCLIERLKIQYLLLTRSEEGMTLFSRNSRVHFQSQAREVYDVSGAGDTVIAILGVMMSLGFSMNQAVKIANQAAGIVVGKFGTFPLTQKDLESCL